MYQIDNSSAASTQPASTAQGTAGWFTDGNAAGGIAATIVPAEWLNSVQAELCNLVTKTGETLTKNTFTQVAQAIQSGKLNYGTDTGTANAYAVSYTLPLGALFTGLTLSFQALHTNTGNSTLNVSGLGSSPIYGAAHVPLQGNEILADGFIEVTWNAALNGGAGAWVLLEQTGGATQVAPATQSQQAVQFGQVAGVIGSVRNLKCSNTAASTSLTWTADEIIVESALAGLRYCLGSFNQTLNGATVGLGGLDTGALAASSYYAVYAAYTSAGAAGIFAQLEPSGGATSVYGGTHLPAGVIATALIGVWPTNGSSQFIQAFWTGRRLHFNTTMAATTNSQISSLTSLSISSIVPKSAIFCSGLGTVLGTTPLQNLQLNVAGTSYGAGEQQVSLSNQAAGGANDLVGASLSNIPIVTAQTVYWSASITSGTFVTVIFYISSYEI
jgi:hypothetical protein